MFLTSGPPFDGLKTPMLKKKIFLGRLFAGIGLTAGAVVYWLLVLSGVITRIPIYFSLIALVMVPGGLVIAWMSRDLACAQCDKGLDDKMGLFPGEMQPYVDQAVRSRDPGQLFGLQNAPWARAGSPQFASIELSVCPGCFNVGRLGAGSRKVEKENLDLTETVEKYDVSGPLVAQLHSLAVAREHPQG